MKGLIILIIFFAEILSASHSDCPTIDMIRAGDFNNFIALNANNNHSASKDMIERFKKKATSFYLEEHFDDVMIIDSGIKNFTIHCYYKNDLEVYLGK